MKYPKVKSVKVLKSYMLEVNFSSNEKKIYDIKPLLKKDMFAPLKNWALFKTAQVEKGGYAVVWNGDIDISEYELWHHGKRKILTKRIHRDSATLRP